MAKFAGKYGLEFTLLADADHAVADQYGTWVEKNKYGKPYWGVQRATLIIAETARFAHVLPEGFAGDADEVVLAALGELAAA